MGMNTHSPTAIIRFIEFQSILCLCVGGILWNRHLHRSNQHCTLCLVSVPLKLCSVQAPHSIKSSATIPLNHTIHRIATWNITRTAANVKTNSKCIDKRLTLYNTMWRMATTTELCYLITLCSFPAGFCFFFIQWTERTVWLKLPIKLPLCYADPWWKL